MLPQQLEASLKKSAALLSLTEKDRDQWKATAEAVTRDLEKQKAAFEVAQNRIQALTDKLAEFAGSIREMAEQLEN